MGRNNGSVSDGYNGSVMDRSSVMDGSCNKIVRLLSFV